MSLVAICRHDESAGIALGEGEETVWDGQRQRHVGHHQIGRAEHHILARAHLGSRERQIEVGMGLVASGIFTMLQKELAIGTTLRQFAGQVTVFLLGINLLDKALLRLEVKGHRVALVGVAAHLKNRTAVERAQAVAKASFERGDLRNGPCRGRLRPHYHGVFQRAQRWSRSRKKDIEEVCRITCGKQNKNVPKQAIITLK